MVKITWSEWSCLHWGSAVCVGFGGNNLLSGKTTFSDKTLTDKGRYQKHQKIRIIFMSGLANIIFVIGFFLLVLGNIACQIYVSYKIFGEQGDTKVLKGILKVTGKRRY
ncbi:MAG: hypothetical protein HS126_39285 [Anaerolineales bacterium]|nr:hypothetical protein [Anaerolineales bacterium]